MTEDNLTKEGAAKIVARLQSIYHHRVAFRIEYEQGSWVVRSDMKRGLPRDGVAYTGYKEATIVGKPDRADSNGRAKGHSEPGEVQDQPPNKSLRWNGKDRYLKDVS